MRHHQTPHLPHPRQSQISNNEEASYDFLVHFNDVKHRLENIEDSLKRLTNKMDETPIKSQYLGKSMINDGLTRKYEWFNYLNMLNSPTIIIFLIAWIFGLFTAFCSKRLFSTFS